MKTWDEAEFVVEGGLDYSFPKMYKISQACTTPHLDDPDNVLSQKVEESDQFHTIKEGQRIAIAVGSRGIDQLQTVVKTVVKKVKEKNAIPIIVPSMGSHGGGNAENQMKILAGYGITEAGVGAPVHSSMEVIQVGSLKNGTPLFCDKFAFESDGIIVINRVKPHTSFSGEIESGLTKMMAIGLGKHKGATHFHRLGFGAMAGNLRESLPIFLENNPILFGVALLENSRDKLSVIEVVEPNVWEETEKKLLKKAKEMMPRIPVDHIDVLIIDEIGKEISGAGMDPNIINRCASPAFEPNPNPKINKIVVLDLTDSSKGNAVGLGVADLITRRLVDKINLSYTYANAITATVLASSRIPMPAPNDREAIALAIKTSNYVEEPKIVWIKNTLAISEMYVSEGCLSQIENNSAIKILEEKKLKFDSDHNIKRF